MSFHLFLPLAWHGVWTAHLVLSLVTWKVGAAAPCLAHEFSLIIQVVPEGSVPGGDSWGHPVDTGGSNSHGGYSLGVHSKDQGE